MVIIIRYIYVYLYFAEDFRFPSLFLIFVSSDCDGEFVAITATDRKLRIQLRLRCETVPTRSPVIVIISSRRDGNYEIVRNIVIAN